MLQEISRTIVPISRQEEVSLLWHNSILTVRTEKEIFLFEYSYNLHCLDKKIDYVSCAVPVSKTSPLTGYIPQQFLREGVSNIDYTEMILDPSLWPHNPELVHEMTNIADLMWSPGILPEHKCVLAVLNNIGNVDIYGKGRYTWTILLDLSELIKKKFFPEMLSAPETLHQLKELAYKLETSAITWCPNLENNSSIFATAQKNGNILFWLLQYKDNTLNPDFIGEIQTDFGEVVSMTWISKPGKDFLIVCCNIHGQIFALDCCNSDFQIYVNNYHTIWAQKDKMVTKFVCYKIMDDKIALFCNKHRHLLTILMNKNCQIITQCVRNINDYRITDIKSNNHGIYLTTINCKIYEIVPKLLNNDLDFNVEMIELSESFPTSDMYGIGFSLNNVLWAVVTKNRKILHRQRKQKTVDLIFFNVTDPKKDEVTLLFENQTQRLTNYWDCIELLRYRTMKTKVLPSIDFHELYYQSDKDIYKAKLYYVFLHYFLNLEKQARNKSRQMLPEMSINAVKEKILALHASQLITEVHEYRINEELLEPLQLETYTSAKKYIEYFCEKNKRDIEEFVNTKEMLHQLKFMPKIEGQVTCQCCDEDIRGFTCSNKHFNMFCSLTFTPIDSYEYLVCRSCGTTARIELFPSNRICTFCDTYLYDSQWQQWDQK